MPPAPQRQTVERSPERVSERTEERRLQRPGTGRLTDDSRFALDRDGIPSGMVMEWKRHSLVGQMDRRNMAVVQQYHWKPVPHKMQKHIYGSTAKDENEHIVVDGLGLYMRPAYLNADAQEETRNETDYQLNQQMQSLRLSSKEQVGDRYTKIKREVVGVQAVPE